VSDPSDPGAEKVVPPLGQLALSRGLITADQLQSALAEQERLRHAGARVRPLGEILVASGALAAEHLAPLLRDAKAEPAVQAAVPAAAPAPAPAPAPKTQRKVVAVAFGKYTILREIGRGGKGVVHEALDTVLDRKVALKMILTDGAADPKALEAEGRRFLTESRISASLPKSPHIVSVYEAGEIEGKRYLAMELIQGHSMTRWRRMSGVTLEQQASLIRDVALALDHAHRNGVVHRDIKPQNILVDRENQPHLTDFGLAKVAGQKEDLAHTVPGMVWGTPTHMSPEHARGLASLDHRADIYSLGVILYESIAGRPPFRSEKPSEILEKVVKEPVPPVAKFVDAAILTPLQRALEPVCRKALSKNPSERHSSAKEFADEIARCLGLGQANPKKKTLLMAGAAAAVLVLALAAFLLTRTSTTEDFEQAERFMSEGKPQEALASYDRVLAHNSGHGGALAGRKTAQKKVADQIEADKRRATDEARREERARSNASEGELKRQMEAKHRADEEETLLQQSRLLAQSREAEERARTAEEAKKKAEDQLKTPATAPTPVPAPAPTPAPATPAVPVPAPVAPTPAPATPGAGLATPAAPTGEPKTLEEGVLHFEAEDFSGGATPVADVDYHDSTPGNGGRAYRTSDVDIGPLPEGGFFVGNIDPGEWLHYRFQGGGRYQIEIRYQGRGNSTVHVEVDGANATGPVPLPPGTDKRGWSTATAFVASLAQGRHELRFVFDTPLLGLDHFRLKPYTPTPAPDAAALRDAERLIHEAFKADYAKRTPNDFLALAKKLLMEAAKPQNDAAARFALFSEASQAAAQAGDIVLAMATIDELDRTYAVDAPALKMEALATASKSAKTPDAARAVAEAYGPVIDQAVERDDYDAALLLCPKAEAAARTAQSPGLLTRILTRTKEITAFRDEFRGLKTSLKTLEEKPADPAANLAVGLYRCFAKADWAHGAPMLAIGSDAQLAALGLKESTPPLEAAAQVTLADGWREAGEKRSGAIKTRYLARALHWYEKALPEIPSLLRLKVESHVESLTKAVYGSSDILRKGLVFWVEPGKEPSDPFREHVNGSKVTNNGCQVVDSGARALQFNLGPANRGWIEYPAADTVRSIDKAGSLFAWIKTDMPDFVGGVVNRGGVSEAVDDFGLWVMRGQVGSWFNYPENRKRLSSKGPIAAGRWTLIGVTWDERNAAFFVDGKEDSVHALTPIELPQRRNTKVSIGSNPPGGHDYYLGLVGSVMIYNRTLSPQESMILFNGTRMRFR
jgi:hypothetical protein